MPDMRMQLIIEALNKTDTAFAALKNSLQQAKGDTKDSASSMQKAWETLGIGSSASIKKQKDDVLASYLLIKNSGTATAEEIVRAEQAKNAAIEKINQANLVNTSSMLSTLKQQWMGYSAVAYAAWSMVQKAVQIMDEGVAELKARESFHAMTKSVGVDADELYAKLKTSTRGLIDNSQLMQRAVFAMSQDIDPNRLPELFKAADVAAKMSGKDISETTDLIIDAVSTNMPRGLRRLGMVTKEQMDIVNKAFAAGITEVNLLDMVLANAAVREADFRSANLQSVETLKQFKVQMQEFKEETGIGLLTLLQKIAAGYQGIVSMGQLALGVMAATRAKTAESMIAQEKDPKIKAWLQQEAYKSRSEATERLKGYNLYRQMGRANLEGKTLEEIQAREAEPTLNRFDRKLAQFSPDTQKIIAEARKQAAEEAAIREIQKKEEMKLAAERVKANATANEAIAGDRLKTTIGIMQKEDYSESELLQKQVEERKKANAQYRQDQIKSINAEADARAANEKYFPKEYFIKEKTQELDQTMKVRNEEVKNLETLAKKQRIVEEDRSEQEAELMVIEEENKARQQTIENLVRIAGHEEKIRNLKIDHTKKMLDLKYQLGEISPREQVSADYQAEIDKLKSEKKKLEDEITANDERLKPGVEGWEQWSEKEKPQKNDRISQIQQEIKNNEQERSLAMKEYSDDWIAGMIAGLKTYETQGKSTFQSIRDITLNAFKDMDEALVDFCKTGKLSFSSLIDSMISDLLRLIIRKNITSKLESGFSDLLGLGMGFLGLSGGTAATAGAGAATSSFDLASWYTSSGGLFPVKHSGGMPSSGPYRLIFAPDLVDLLPRRHSGGLATNERLVVNKINERYISEEQNEWLTGVARAMTSKGESRLNQQNISLSIPIDVPVDSKKLKSDLRNEIERKLPDMVLKIVREHL